MAQSGSDTFPSVGRPLARLGSMNMPDKADQRPTIMDWLKLIFKSGIPLVIGFIRHRAPVVDARLASVRGLIRLSVINTIFTSGQVLRAFEREEEL